MIDLPGQCGTLAGPHAVNFPYDDPQTILSALATARQAVAHILEGIDVLDALYRNPAPAASHALRLVSPELHRDLSMMGRIPRVPTSRIPEAVPIDVTDGWLCPQHGASDLVTLHSRTRTYRTCRSCEEFER